MKLDLNFVCKHLSVPMLPTNVEVTRVVTDSRQIQQGDLFFALTGENFDAHDFVVDVLKQGAVAAVVCTDFALNDPRFIKVSDPQMALGTLAHAWRLVVDPVILGITGSSGKTTVKEMTASILRDFAGEDAVLATQGNLNNDIGVPLMLLRLTPKHRFAVIEMGMNHFGELSYLTKIVQPDVALINNALRAHIGCGFDGVADIAHAKSEIYEGLPEKGIGIVPQEDPHLSIFVAALKGKEIRSFGVSSGDVTATNINLHQLNSDFLLRTPRDQISISLPCAGQHNVANALAAASLCLAIDVPLSNIAQGLSVFKNIKGRLELKKAASGAQVIDDTYNANPDSMKRSLDVLAKFAAPRIFVMGDLGELGAGAPALHAEVGAYAKSLGIEHFFALGELSQNAAVAFGAEAHHFVELNLLLDALLPVIVANTSILVKGSRFMKMERVVDALVRHD